MKQRELLFILISVTFVVGMWIVFSILHSSLSSTLSQQTVANSKPIAATFDTKTLNLLKKRTVIEPQGNLVIPPSPTPTSVPIVTAPPLQTKAAPLSSGSGTASGGATTQ